MKLTDDGAKVPVDAKVPIYVMLVPQGKAGLVHRTYIDRITLDVGAGAPTKVAQNDGKFNPFYLPQSVKWTGPQARPAPDYAKTGNVKRLTPKDDLQAALDGARAGDTFLLAPGVYHQRVEIRANGSADKPIVLAAQTPGTVTLSGVNPNLKPAFEPVENGLYRAPVPYLVRGLMANGRNVFPFHSLEHLKNRTVPKGDQTLTGAPPEGYAWENGFLYLRLVEDADPRAAKIEVARDYQIKGKPDSAPRDAENELKKD